MLRRNLMIEKIIEAGLLIITQAATLARQPHLRKQHSENTAGIKTAKRLQRGFLVFIQYAAVAIQFCGKMAALMF